MSKRLKIWLIVVLAVAAAPLSADPVAYSINSDSGSEQTTDSLYRIDLATGVETRIGQVQSLGEVRMDVEGLAFAPDGTLYGIDDSSVTLFPINLDNAFVQSNAEVWLEQLDDFNDRGRHDFGMTFACDGQLYLSSVKDDMLYRLELTGEVTPVGSLGGADIVALASRNDPVELYGLGRGITAPQLYRIDPTNGTANPIGTGLGPLVAAYTEGGLAFDDAGRLWAITDATQLSLDRPSQTMRIDTNTGLAFDVRDTLESGFESLAITVPRGCENGGSGELAQFLVQKRFTDLNDQTPVTLNIQCRSGTPVQSSVTVTPNDGPFGMYEVNFVVDNIPNGVVSCEIWESDVNGYSPTYSCFSEGDCTAEQDRCVFDDSTTDQANLCLIRNYADPVTVTVATEWFYGAGTERSGEQVTVDLVCENVIDGDGSWNNGQMTWSWVFDAASAPKSASLVPDFAGATYCSTATRSSSAVESESDCDDWIQVLPGENLGCTVTNTLFFEGVPTLSQYGLALFAALMLLTGAAAGRRF
jgi:hypothetical protein